MVVCFWTLLAFRSQNFTEEAKPVWNGTWFSGCGGTAVRAGCRLRAESIGRPSRQRRIMWGASRFGIPACPSVRALRWNRRDATKFVAGSLPWDESHGLLTSVVRDGSPGSCAGLPHACHTPKSVVRAGREDAKGPNDNACQVQGKGGTTADIARDGAAKGSHPADSAIASPCSIHRESKAVSAPLRGWPPHSKSLPSACRRQSRGLDTGEPGARLLP